MKRQWYCPYELSCPYIFPRINSKIVMTCELISLQFAQLTGGAVPCTFGAESAENKLAFTNNSFAERTRCGLGYVIPIHILNTAAVVADEVVMLHIFRIKPSGAAFDGNLAYQTNLHQITKIVISGGTRGTWIHTVYGLKNFCSRGMPGVVH